MGRKRNVRNRSFTGCWVCRSRKVKCDETKPTCLACHRTGIVCSGYEPRYIWITEGNHSPQTSGSSGRQVLKCASTWAGQSILSSDLVEFLILQCDDSIELSRDLVASRIGLKPSHNPFSVFPIDHPREKFHWYELSPLENLSDSIPQSLPFDADASAADSTLLQHYVNHVALLMMPYEHSRNPWKLHYPLTALSCISSNQSTLYHALLAQSAFNIAQLRGNDISMVEAGLRHYDLAIRQLSRSLDNGKEENTNLRALFAAIMTLLFVEIYSGQPRRWRYHFRGAWNLFQKHVPSESWKATDFVCVSTQSLHIIKIIGDSSWIANDEGQSRDYDVDFSASLPSISSTDDFGFTIGASRLVLRCIHRITKFSKERQCAHTDEDLNSVVQEVLQCLNTCLKEDGRDIRPALDCRSESLYYSVTAPETPFQKTAFIYATYIYLYRTLLDVPPHVVKEYVSKTFENVLKYFAEGGGNFSIWPAFIAAVEAYEEEDKIKARVWLEWATSFGLGSRALVRQVVEEVWRRRDEIALCQRVPPGTVIVDWKKIMHELGCDVLLV